MDEPSTGYKINTVTCILLLAKEIDYATIVIVQEAMGH